MIAKEETFEELSDSEQLTWNIAAGRLSPDITGEELFDAIYDNIDSLLPTLIYME